MPFNLYRYAQLEDENSYESEELPDETPEELPETEEADDPMAQESDAMISQSGQLLNSTEINNTVTTGAKDIADQFAMLLRNAGLDGIAPILGPQESQLYLNRIIEQTLTKVQQRLGA